MLKQGQIAPDFSALNQDNELIELAKIKGCKNIVLYFYPKDDTPGCTIEANDFTTLAADFLALDTIVIGVSKDSCHSHMDFIKKYSLKLDLLADESGEICENYGVWQMKEKNGIQKMAILRSTFIIDKAGSLVATLYGVSHEGQAQAVLEQVKAL
jgi:peroxiredoxin